MAFSRRCSPSRFVILCLGMFMFILVFLITDTLRECSEEEIIATKTLLQKYSYQIQELKNRNSQLKSVLERKEMETRDKNNKSSLSFVSGLPIIYIITPTYSRLEQKAELTRMSHTLRLVKNIHWIIIEDSDIKTDLVIKFLENCGLQYTHLNAVTPPNVKLASTDPNWLKPRGVLQRNAGLQWLRNRNIPSSQTGVVYFADDDNTYSLKVFDEMRFTKKASVWPVGLVGYLRYEKPIVKNQKVVGWFTSWKPTRPFAMDMAGFAVNLQMVLDYPRAGFSNSVQRGYQESNFLSGLLLKLEDLEPKAKMCTEILVWHTRTEKSSTKNEDKLIQRFGHGSDLSIEV